MSARIADLQDFHWIEWASKTGIAAPYRDVREHAVAVDRMSPVARAAGVTDQELQNERESYDVHAKRRVELAWARGAETEVGRALAGHDARHSATLRWWLSRSIPSLE